MYRHMQATPGLRAAHGVAPPRCIIAREAPPLVRHRLPRYLLACGYSLACIGFRDPRCHLGQRLAGACSTASLCSSCPLVGVVGPRFTGQDLRISAPCGQRLAGACSSASLCSSCPLVGVSRAAIHRSHLLRLRTWSDSKSLPHR